MLRWTMRMGIARSSHSICSKNQARALFSRGNRGDLRGVEANAECSDFACCEVVDAGFKIDGHSGQIDLHVRRYAGALDGCIEIWRELHFLSATIPVHSFAGAIEGEQFDL